MIPKDMSIEQLEEGLNNPDIIDSIELDLRRELSDKRERFLHFMANLRHSLCGGFPSLTLVSFLF